MFSTLILTVGLVATLIIAVAALHAGWSTARYRDPHEVRRILANGVLGALGFLVIAALLKTIELRDWHGIGMFAAVLGMRTLVKWDFASVLSEEARR